MPSDRPCKERNEERKKKKEREKEEEERKKERTKKRIYRPCSQHLTGFTVFGEGVGLKNGIEVT